MSSQISILSARDANTQINSGHCKVIDATWYLPDAGKNAYQDYLARHIPGAHFFDIDAVADENSNLPHMLPSPEDFAAAMSALGVSNNHQIIIYDQSPVLTAARLAWTLKAFGHMDIAVLDGGLDAWTAEDYPIESGEVKAVKAAYSVRDTTEQFCSWEAVTSAINSDAAQILDARAAERFKGLVPEPRAGLRSGHIPSAKNLPFGRLFDAAGSYKSTDEIIRELTEAGIDLNKPIITSCGSGITACVLAVALEKVGKTDVKVYDGSWTEWGGRQDLPIETGASN